MWWLSLLAGSIAGVVLGPSGTAGVVTRLGPVLVFVAAATIIADLANKAGVFEQAAWAAASLGGGRVWRLWALVFVLATASTIVLSLDTTAVLLTPVVLSLARQIGIPPKMFAMTAVWLAGTASLLLPVSNLTNLLALQTLADLGLGPRDYVALSWRPALAAIAVTGLVLVIRFRAELTGHYLKPARSAVEDRPLFLASVALCLALGPAFVSGVPVAWSACVAAAILIGAFLLRRHPAVSLPRIAALLPWRLACTLTGLFLVVAAFADSGLNRLLAELVGEGHGVAADLRMVGTAALFANAGNNLPAYLALEQTAINPHQLLICLIGVNCGCLLSVWGSVATLLWRDRCRAVNVTITWREFLLEGLWLTPAVLAAAVVAARASVI